jgi:hypothetical protein
MRAQNTLWKAHVLRFVPMPELRLHNVPKGQNPHRETSEGKVRPNIACAGVDLERVWDLALVLPDGDPEPRMFLRVGAPVCNVNSEVTITVHSFIQKTGLRMEV